MVHDHVQREISRLSSLAQCLDPIGRRTLDGRSSTVAYDGRLEPAADGKYVRNGNGLARCTHGLQRVNGADEAARTWNDAHAIAAYDAAVADASTQYDGRNVSRHGIVDLTLPAKPLDDAAVTWHAATYDVAAHDASPALTAADVPWLTINHDAAITNATATDDVAGSYGHVVARIANVIAADGYAIANGNATAYGYAVTDGPTVAWNATADDVAVTRHATAAVPLAIVQTTMN